MESNAQNILCFICGSYIPSSEIQNHVYKCKLSYEVKTKSKITLPDEYNLLFKTIKGGLTFSSEDLDNFNSLLASKSVKSYKAPLSNTMGSSMGSSMGGGNFSQTMPQQRRKSPPRQPGQRPRMMVCPLCGREFGTMSLPIHMKTCRQRFEMQQQNLPRNMRKSADRIIEQYNKNNAMLQSTGNYNMDELNNQAFETYNKEALVPCENCGRTFLPDRLIVHLRSCKKKIK